MQLGSSSFFFFLAHSRPIPCAADKRAEKQGVLLDILRCRETIMAPMLWDCNHIHIQIKPDDYNKLPRVLEPWFNPKCFLIGVLLCLNFYFLWGENKILEFFPICGSCYSCIAVGERRRNPISALLKECKIHCFQEAGSNH